VSTKLLAALFIPTALWPQTATPDKDFDPSGEVRGKPDVTLGLQEDHPRAFGNGEPIIPDMSSRSEAKPISGVVSVRQLQHPVPRKALDAARQAEQYSRENNTAKAIEKLEQAVRIDPLFREAQTNLGARYVRSGRLDEAVPHFQKAYDAGPPDPITCANLAWAYTRLGRFREAEAMARKALELDPGNPKAEKILRYAAAH
jgi:Flp pilus assembly protein TadD